jgi:hypothetical protein
MENPDNEDIIIHIEETFDQITSLLFPPFQSCFIYHVLLVVDDVVTSNQDLWLVRDKMYRDPCCTE